MSWSESGARPPPKEEHTWHRLSVHVKRQEASSNQTAVIRPLTKPDPGADLRVSELSAKTLYNVSEEEEGEPARYRPPDGPSSSSADVRGPARLFKEGAELPAYATAERFRGGALLTDRLWGAADRLEPLLGPDFTDDIVQPGPRNAVGGPYQPHLTQQVVPLQMADAPFSTDARPPEEVEGGRFDLIRGFVLDSARLHGQEEEEDEELLHPKLVLEDSPALTPPSPFRDSICSGSSAHSSALSSPESEMALCAPPNVTYAPVILRDYKQSSSTL